MTGSFPENTANVDHKEPGGVSDTSSAAYTSRREGETLIDFMKRMEYLSASTSAKYAAWLTGKPVGQVAAELESKRRVKREMRRGGSRG